MHKLCTDNMRIHAYKDESIRHAKGAEIYLRSDNIAPVSDEIWRSLVDSFYGMISLPGCHGAICQAAGVQGL